ncbi:MAG: hypothetical protein ACRC7G_15075 [Beijerinckiaceae bacterium]
MKFLASAAMLVVSAGSVLAADGIGGQNENIMVLQGTVVDVLCELTGRCSPAACASGQRQLGLKLGDGKLVLLAKGPEIFAGVQLDLAPHCGKNITVDGVMFENPKMLIYMVQGIKTDPAQAEFAVPDAFPKAWTAKNGPAEEWFRADPAVKDLIARNGPLGRIDLKPKP